MSPDCHGCYRRHNKEHTPHLLEKRLPSQTTHTFVCIAAEDMRCQSPVQHIPAQIGRPSQTRLGQGTTFQEETQFSIDNHHSDLLSLVVFHKIRLHHVAKQSSFRGFSSY